MPTSTIFPIFLQAGCPSCRPTNSVKALKANSQEGSDKNFVSLTVRIDGLSDVTLIVTVVCGLQTQKCLKGIIDVFV